MTLDALIIGAGAFVALLPFLGFPVSWDTVLFFLAGVFIIGLGIAVRRNRGASEPAVQRKAETFAESVPQRSEPISHEEQTTPRE